MKGIVIMNARPNGEKFYRQSERIAGALCRLGAETEIVLNGSVPAIVGAKRPTEKKTADFAVYLDKDKYLGRILEGAGIRLFNRAAAVEVCDDKLLTCLAVALDGLPFPDCIPAPL